MSDVIKLIVGLGNPGPKYQGTRHNVGFWLVQRLAEKYAGAFKLEPKFRSFISEVNIENHKCHLLLPETLMNLSGEAVVKVVNFYKIPLSAILVVHDELDFAPGVIRLKQAGSANGHNGVQNIIDQLGNKNFWRLRVGIGRAEFKEDLASYVLEKPGKFEASQIQEAISRAVSILPELISGNSEKAMTALHLV